MHDILIRTKTVILKRTGLIGQSLRWTRTYVHSTLNLKCGMPTLDLPRHSALCERVKI